MKHEKSCGAICYTREEGAPRVLVICHRYGGHWAFPKGHVEAGESEEETAMREVREETGAQVRVRPGYREVTTYSPAKGVTKDVVFFVATGTVSRLGCRFCFLGKSRSYVLQGIRTRKGRAREENVPVARF